MKKTLLMVVFCLFAEIASATNYCKDSSIVACYPTQEGTGTVLADNSTNGRNGSFASSGHPLWQSSAPDRAYLTKSINFSSSSDYVTLGSSNIVLVPSQPQTIVMWFNTTADLNVGNPRILSRNSGGESFLGFDPTKSFALNITGTTTLVVNPVDNNYTFSSWNHLTLTWDGSTTASNVHIYVNGVEVSYATQTNGASLTNTSAGTIYLGNRSDGLRGVIGNLTEIAVFNRVLSSTEINDIYNNGLLQKHINTINNATVNNATIN